LKIKNKKDAVTGTFRDIFGKEEKIKHPIFTQNEIARISAKRKLYPVLFFLLLVFEGMIYALLANLITPRDLREAFPPITLIFGLGFAIVFVVALHFGFQYYFSYLEAKEIVESKNLGKEKLRKYVVKRNMAYFVFFTFIVTNLATAIIRALILEPKGGGTDDYGTPLFVMSLGLTFIAALAMGLIEHELFEKNEKYEVFKNWKRQNKERKEYMTAIKDLYFSSGKIIARFREEYWSVVLDYQRIFECRHDSIDEPLYNKFEAEIAAGTIKLNEIDDNVYSKYKLVQSASEELFILSYLKEIKESVDEIAAYEKVIEEGVNENATTTNEIKS